MIESRSVVLARKLIAWWNHLDSGCTLSMQAAHDLAGIVTLAQGLVDLEESRMEEQQGLETEEVHRSDPRRTCS